MNWCNRRKNIRTWEKGEKSITTKVAWMPLLIKLSSITSSKTGREKTNNNQHQPTSTTRGTECLEGMRRLEEKTGLKADARGNKEMTTGFNVHQAMKWYEQRPCLPPLHSKVCVLCACFSSKKIIRVIIAMIFLWRSKRHKERDEVKVGENKCKTDTRSTSSCNVC